jgi:phage tail-like protein
VRAAAFASASTVTVRATATPIADGVSVDRTYLFAVTDTVPPILTAASARDTKTIVASWSKTVLDHGFRGASNPARYALTPTLDGIHPAVTPTVVIATPTDLTTTTLQTDIALSPGVSYTLTESGVADYVGNFTTSSATFAAFVPPKPALRSWDLYRKLPAMNRIQDISKDLFRFISCLQEVTDLLLFDIDSWPNIFDLDVAGDPYLDAMLEDLGNPFPFVLTTIQKRQLLRILVSLYKQKGTAIGIINAVRFFLGLDVTISFPAGSLMSLGKSKLGVDWILSSGARRTKYSFSIVSAASLTPDQIAQITFIARYMKCAHEHLIRVVVPSVAPVYDPVVLGVSRLGIDWKLHLG